MLINWYYIIFPLCLIAILHSVSAFFELKSEWIKFTVSAVNIILHLAVIGICLLLEWSLTILSIILVSSAIFYICMSLLSIRIKDKMAVKKLPLQNQVEEGVDGNDI